MRTVQDVDVMQTVDIDQARACLSELVDQAADGEGFIIEKAGKPMVKVVAVDILSPSPVRRCGFLAGQISVPDDFDEMGREEIERIFGASS